MVLWQKFIILWPYILTELLSGVLFLSIDLLPEAHSKLTIMNKFLFATVIAGAIFSNVSAEVKVTAVPVGEKPNHQPMKAATVTGEVLVYENFDKWEAGTVEEPNWDNPLTSYDDDLIDKDLMNDNMQWAGSKVYEAGGTCALRTFDPWGSALLCTPLGDYSGSVKVTFLAKSIRVSWEDEEGSTWKWTGSSISIGLYTKDYKEFEVGENDGLYYNLCDVRMYEEYGWYEITVEFDNYTAYNDASLWFSCPDGVLLDDIKVTSSVDKFIASPIMEGISDLTQTSFTVNFQPVRKAFNYYTYLFELYGYDEETGEPIYMPIPDPKDFAEFEEYGVSTYKEYWEVWYGLSEEDFETSWYLEKPYCYYGSVEYGKPTSFTYSDLDPEKQYYYAVRSHYVHQFSPMDIYPMNKIAAPEAFPATDIKDNSFVAKWGSIAKADCYEVNLYGVNKVMEDTDNFIIFEEDFDNVSNYTDSDDIYDPGVVDSDSGITIDDLTSTPGWDTEVDHTLLVNGMLGLDDWNYWLFTPELYVAGSDKVTVSLNASFLTEDASFYVRFAGKTYEVPVYGDTFEGEIELPTNGLATTKFQITGPEYECIFIDYIIISQSLKKGEYTYTYMGTNQTEDTEFAFSGLDAERFDMYGYSVKAIHGEGKAAIYSDESDRIIVDLQNGSSMAGVTETEMVSLEEVKEIGRFTIDGKRIDEPVKGINIIRMSDGSTRKVMVK